MSIARLQGIANVRPWNEASLRLKKRTKIFILDIGVSIVHNIWNKYDVQNEILAIASLEHYKFLKKCKLIFSRKIAYLFSDL